VSRPRSGVLVTKLLSGNRELRNQTLAEILTAYFKFVMHILRRRFWSLREQDWEDVWSQAICELDRMVTDGEVELDIDLEKLLLKLTGKRAAALLRSQLRYQLRLTRLFANSVHSCEKKDGMFVLLEGVEAHAAKMTDTERLVLFTAVMLLNRCGTDDINRLPSATLAAMVNGRADPQLSPKQARKILRQQWRNLRAFLLREGFNHEP
jgi:hypothetical protein